MNKQEIYALLSARNIWHEVTEHKAVYNMAEMAENPPCPTRRPMPRNLFIRDDKKRNYYLITVKGNKRVDLKAFRAAERHPAAYLCLGSGSDGHAWPDSRRGDTLWACSMTGNTR